MKSLTSSWCASVAKGRQRMRARDLLSALDLLDLETISLSDAKDMVRLDTAAQHLYHCYII
jgi:hypothetical protein